MKKVVFVCTANVCRSPMAEALLRHRLEERGLSAELQVSSAGIYASPDEPASDLAIEVLDRRGISLREHRSQPVTPALLEDAGIMLVMEEHHRQFLFHLAPQHLRKLFLLSEMVGKHVDIADPYGGTLEDYARTVQSLSALIDEGLPRILKLVGVE